MLKVLSSVRRSLAKVRSAAALLDIRGNDARVALPGSRSIPSLGPLPQPMEESRPRRKAILRKPVSKHAKMFLKKESALDTAMAELAKLAGASALPENASGAGALVRVTGCWSSTSIILGACPALPSPSSLCVPRMIFAKLLSPWHLCAASAVRRREPQVSTCERRC